MGVLVSGRGTNLEALVRAAGDPSYPAQVVAVAANRPHCAAMERARHLGVPARAFPVREFGDEPQVRDRAMTGWLLEQGCEIVVLAGYDRILTPPLMAAFPGRILNLHNSLLPAFAGTMRAVAQALEYGVKVSGCTVHLVDPDLVDGGPIVLQAVVAVADDDTEETLLQRIHEQEWRILPEAVGLLAAGRLVVDGRRVRRMPP